ncbi:MAG: DUF3160 domain-containing protein, partial [Actinomycetota bacterium]|nr:DUF3160 domain-containing protein [Actinomycetota bacterium]
MAALLVAPGCDLGGISPTYTPITNPTNTVPAVTATAAAVPTVPAGTDTPAPPTDTAALPPTGTTIGGESPTPGTPEAALTPALRQVVHFADYKLQPSLVTPSLKPYKVSPGLANVSNAGDFQLSAPAKALIEQNAFAVQFPDLPQDQQFKQFYQLYEDGRYGDKPVFVSTDSILHVYHLMFDKLLRSTETGYLIGDLKNLTAAMLQTTQQQYGVLKGTAAENAAKRNLAYFAVAARLLDPSAPVPADVQSVVAQELGLISAHQGLAQSAVMGIGGEQYMEDYGQYVPRGHYTRSEELKKYFQAMMWYGRITFRLRDVDETRSAILLTLALQGGQTTSGVAAKDAWANIYDPTTFFVGGSDDLTYRDYAPLIQQAIGGADLQVVGDDSKIAQFQQLAKSLQGPRINSMFVYVTEDKDTATKGLRMMGQRFTLDEYLLGQLVWRNVGTADKPRGLPKGLDVPAALGSDEALKVLTGMGETQYPNYSRQLDKVRGQVAGLPASQWTENLYWSWLYTFRPLLQPKAPDSGYPSFMTNSAWTRKDLNTVLG